MRVFTDQIEISTKGYRDIVDVTSHVNEFLKQNRAKNGQVTIFAPGATAGVTTIEYEPGLIRDLPEALERLAPKGIHYHHDATWGDGNGNSHIQASMLGPSLTVPFKDGRLILGTWQQIVIVDCDNRARHRKIVIQMIGD